MGAEPTTILDINGRPVPVRLRRNGRARRILLRLDNHGDGVIVTLPKGVPEAEGVAWAEKQAAWVASRLSAMPTRTLFSKGAVIPFEGEGPTSEQELTRAVGKPNMGDLRHRPTTPKC